MEIDKKIVEIGKRKNFTSFWECFDYMKLANYNELEALMTSLELFDGKVWNRVINAAMIHPKNDIAIFSSGATYTVSGSTGFSNSHLNIVRTNNQILAGIDPCNSDDLFVEIFLMTADAKDWYIPLYRSFVETRIYEPIKELEKHIKAVQINLTTELAINLFKSGYEKFK